jgi:hypothetical protein
MTKVVKAFEDALRRQKTAAVSRGLVAQRVAREFNRDEATSWLYGQLKGGKYRDTRFTADLLERARVKFDLDREELSGLKRMFAEEYGWKLAHNQS